MKNTDIIPGTDYVHEPWDGYVNRVRVLKVEPHGRLVYRGRSYRGDKVTAPMVLIRSLRADGTPVEVRAIKPDLSDEPTLEEAAAHDAAPDTEYREEWVLPRTIKRTWEDQAPIERAKRERQQEKDAGVQRAKDLKPEVTARIKALFGDRTWVPTNEYTPGGKVELTFEQFLAATTKEDA